METLTTISILIGIGAGIVAILQYLTGFIPKRTNFRKLFQEEFKIWMDSEHSHIMDESTFKKLVGYMNKKAKSNEEKAFALLNANHFGHKSFKNFIDKNINNDFAIEQLFESLYGKGIRVGWRAEYALCRLDRAKVIAFIENMPDETKQTKVISKAIARITNDGLVAYLENRVNGNDQKLKSYAHEVLTQINSPIVAKN